MGIPGSPPTPPHPTGFPLPGLPGFPCFLRGRLRGFTPGFAARSPWVQPFPAAFASWEAAGLTLPRRPPRGVGLHRRLRLGPRGAPGSSRGGQWRPAEVGRPRLGASVFPAATKARDPPPRGRGTPSSGSNGERGARRRKLWGGGAIPGLWCPRPPCPFHAFFGLCGVCVPVPLSPSASDSVSLSAPHLHPCTLPRAGGRGRRRPGGGVAAAAAAAARRRGWLLSLVI